jgi:hypothetical protein
MRITRFSAVFATSKVQALVDFVAANAAKIKALEVIEHVFKHCCGRYQR